MELNGISNGFRHADPSVMGEDIQRNTSFKVLPEEILPPTWSDELYGEPQQGTINVVVNNVSSSGGHTYLDCDFYYSDGFAKRVSCQASSLQRRFPRSFITSSWGWGL